MGWVLHLDVDAFFAAVEQREDARLRGRPVAVGTGVVASCSYEAKRAGVSTGMRLADARRACPALVVLPGDYRRYEQASRRILAICHEATPQVELAALDDLYLDLGARDGAAAEQAALALAQVVEAEVGLRVSLGLGTSKLVAAVATQAVKDRKAQPSFRALLSSFSGDLAIVPAGTERAYLAPWPARVLPGVGPKVADRLERLNVRRVGEVAQMPPGLLCTLFGARGRVLRDLARGIDPRPVQPARPALSVSRRTSFDPPVSEHPFLLAMLDHLLDRAVSWLRVQGLQTRGLALHARYGDYQAVDSRISLPEPSDDEAALRAAARARFARLYTRRLPLRLLGVELAPLAPAGRQAELFPDPAAERARRLTDCKDDIRARFGFLALTSGTALELAGRLERDRDNFRLRTPCLTR
jgi:DNA polymerase-4